MSRITCGTLERAQADGHSARHMPAQAASNKCEKPWARSFQPHVILPFVPHTFIAYYSTQTWTHLLSTTHINQGHFSLRAHIHCPTGLHAHCGHSPRVQPRRSQWSRVEASRAGDRATATVCAWHVPYRTCWNQGTLVGTTRTQQVTLGGRVALATLPEWCGGRGGGPHTGILCPLCYRFTACL